MSALRFPKNFEQGSVEGSTATAGRIRGVTVRKGPALSLRQYPSTPTARLTVDHAPAAWPTKLSPVLRFIVSMTLLVAAVAGISMIHGLMPAAPPPSVLLILPVIAAGLLFGRVLGLTTLLAAILADRLLYYPHAADLAFAGIDDALSFGSIAAAMVGSSIVALYANSAAREVEKTEARCHNFNRDVLLAVTSGRLVLCDDDEIAEMTAGISVHRSTVAGTADLYDLRRGIQDAVRAHLPEDRIGDLVTCVTEAVTNALKYAGAAGLETWIGPEFVSVVVSDQGAGIDPSLLARATLESGFSTKNTLGMGFTLMLGMADKIALHTSSNGTRIVIQIRRA